MLMIFVLAGAAFVIFTQSASNEDDVAETKAPPRVLAATPAKAKAKSVKTTKAKPETPRVVENPETNVSKPPVPKPERPVRTASGDIAIESMKLEPSDGERWVLELQVRYHNKSENDLELVAPTAQLLTGEGESIPEFFAAFAKAPVAPAEAEQLVELRYWLNQPDPEENLELKILDESIVVALEQADDGSVVRD